MAQSINETQSQPTRAALWSDFVDGTRPFIAIGLFFALGWTWEARWPRSAVPRSSCEHVRPEPFDAAPRRSPVVLLMLGITVAAGCAEGSGSNTFKLPIRAGFWTQSKVSCE